MYKKILVPLDGSRFSEEALRHALDIAKKSGSEIILTHVVERPALESVGKKILEQGNQKVAAQGVKCEVKILHGNPAERIIKLSAEDKCDLIVIGSRGLTGIKRFFIGSVSGRVSRYAECPVLIVKKEE